MRTVARHAFAGLMLGALLQGTGDGQTTGGRTAPLTEYANPPIGRAELDVALRQSRLVVAGQIVQYQAGLDYEQATVAVAETWKGSTPAGAQVTFACVCHMERPPASDSFVGHHVIVLLAPDGAAGSKGWHPATTEFVLFAHPELRTQIMRALRRQAAGTEEVRR